VYVCHVAFSWQKTCTEQTSATLYNSEDCQCSSLQLTRLENVAMFAVNLLILLAGAGVLVCDF